MTRRLCLLVAAVFVLGLLAAPRVYHQYDVVDCFLAWARASGGTRPWGVYTPGAGADNCDYPALVPYLLTLAEAGRQGLGAAAVSATSVLLLKLPGLLAHLAAAPLAGFRLPGPLGKAASGRAAALPAVCPALFGTSPAWRQIRGRPPPGPPPRAGGRGARRRRRLRGGRELLPLPHGRGLQHLVRARPLRRARAGPEPAPRPARRSGGDRPPDLSPLGPPRVWCLHRAPDGGPQPAPHPCCPSLDPGPAALRLLHAAHPSPPALHRARGRVPGRPRPPLPARPRPLPGRHCHRHPQPGPRPRAGAAHRGRRRGRAHDRGPSPGHPHRPGPGGGDRARERRPLRLRHLGLLAGGPPAPPPPSRPCRRGAVHLLRPSPLPPHLPLAPSRVAGTYQ